MFKKALSIIALAGMVACSKSNSSNPVTPSTPNTTTKKYEAHFLPNWWNNDTMVTYVYNTAGGPSGYDTVFTKSYKDTSYIVYKGKQYYIWTATIDPLDTFENDKSVYINIYINNRLDTLGALVSGGVLTQVHPAKYKNSSGATGTSRQLLAFGDPKNCLNKNTFVNGWSWYSALTIHY